MNGGGDMDDQRLACLIDSYIAGVLSADEQRELHRYLAFSPAARQQYDRHIVAYCTMHPGVRLPDAAELLRDLNDALQPESQELVAASTPEVVSKKLQAWCAGGALSVISAAALLLFVRQAPLPLYGAPETVADDVAVLQHAANVQWLNLTNEMFAGETLPTGRVQIASGAMEVELKRGTRLVVEGPADLQLVSDNEAFLRFGKATAFVPDTAHGFRLTAPAVAVTDLGTEFGLIASTNGRSDLHVFAGVIEMDQLTRKPRRMLQGQALQVQGSRVRKLPVNRATFLFEGDVAREENAEQRERLQTWKMAAEALSCDPAAVVHFTFEDSNAGDGRLANAAISSKARAAKILGGVWTDGRWPGKRAFAFVNKSDRIRFEVPNTMTSLTYMAWLRVDQLLSTSNALAITESGAQGEVHWQIYRDGRVALSAHSGKSGNVDQTWDRGISPAIFTTNRFGKWTHLVSVYDVASRTINHYVNGEFVSSSPIKRPLPLKLGAVEIGNWGVRVDQPRWASMKSAGPAYLNRFWNGRIDEFALLSRALTREEIQRYYRRGRVALGLFFAGKS